MEEPIPVMAQVSLAAQVIELPSNVGHGAIVVVVVVVVGTEVVVDVVVVVEVVVVVDVVVDVVVVDGRVVVVVVGAAVVVVVGGEMTNPGPVQLAGGMHRELPLLYPQQTQPDAQTPELLAQTLLPH